MKQYIPRHSWIWFPAFLLGISFPLLVGQRAKTQVPVPQLWIIAAECQDKGPKEELEGCVMEVYNRAVELHGSHSALLDQLQMQIYELTP